MLKKGLLCSLLATAPLAHAAKWFEEMQIGPAWSNTFEDTFQGQKRVAAIKGVLIDLGDRKAHALFDTETLQLVTAYEGFIHWGATPWTGEHGKLIALADENPVFNTGGGSGWADATGSFKDTRPLQGFGNFPHARLNGFFRSGRTIVLDYAVLGARILETPVWQDGALTRSFKTEARATPLVFRVADEAKPFEVAADGSSAKTADGLNVRATGDAKLAADPENPNRLIAKLPAAPSGSTFGVSLKRGGEPAAAPAVDFDALVKGGAPIWDKKIEVAGVVSTDTKSPYVTDVATLPEDNPWHSNLRFGGFDFIDEDSAALSSWNGDVWVVKGLKGDWKKLVWQRIASGLFEPLGLKVVKGEIYVNGRDQITKLIDLNGDGETDRYESFNRDVYVSSNFHEFAFDLQTDKDGNFYFAKASPVRGGGRGFDRILPNHGTVMKISPDGKKLEVVATGLRAPGGLGVGPNGEITTGENEGTWEPACKINFARANELPVFFGCEPSRQTLTDAPYTEPLCFLPMDVDNSGGSQVWVPQNAKFGMQPGELLHLSYGMSGVFRVLPQRVDGKLQGGATRLPVKLQSSAMRGRFHDDGSLFVLGFRGWQTNAASECAFQRVRYTGQTPPVPDKYEVTKTGVRLHFAQAISAELANDPASYSVQRWNYVRSSQYGSGEFSVDHPEIEREKAALDRESKDYHKRDEVAVKSAKLQGDGKTIELELEGMKPSMQLKVAYDLEDENGQVLNGNVHSTVYKLPESASASR